MKKLARLGCIARSVVYFLIGILALLVAVGNRHGQTTDTHGALRVILTQPFGFVLLMFLGVGLLAFAIWRMLQSLLDRDRWGKGPLGLSVRFGFLLSSLAHASLAFYAFNLTFNFSRSSEWGERMLAKWILLHPMGRYMLELLGVVVVAVGTVQFFSAFSLAFLRNIHIPGRRAKILVPICQFGLVARGVVFVITGSLFVQAGLKLRSREAGGLDRAWDILYHRPFGGVVLGLVAVGFMAFAVFGSIEGFYRKTV